MDRVRISILVIGLALIILFTYYTFSGPSTYSPEAGTKIEPVRKLILTKNQNSISIDNEPNNADSDIKNIELRPIKAEFYFVTHVSNIKKIGSSAGSNSLLAQDRNTQHTSLSLNIYENKDVPENYYSIGFPDSINVVQGSKPGSFVAESGAYGYSSELQDIPDDSNVQLFTLTRAEPTLKSSLTNYKLIDSGQLQVGANRAWDLVYTWTNSTENIKTMKVYIEGQDEAALITFSTPSETFASYNTTLESVLKSFSWL